MSATLGFGFLGFRVEGLGFRTVDVGPVSGASGRCRVNQLRVSGFCTNLASGGPTTDLLTENRAPPNQSSTFQKKHIRNSKVDSRYEHESCHIVYTLIAITLKQQQLPSADLHEPAYVLGLDPRAQLLVQ